MDVETHETLSCYVCQSIDELMQQQLEESDHVWMQEQVALNALNGPNEDDYSNEAHRFEDTEEALVMYEQLPHEPTDGMAEDPETDGEHDEESFVDEAAYEQMLRDEEHQYRQRQRQLQQQTQTNLRRQR